MPSGVRVDEEVRYANGRASTNQPYYVYARGTTTQVPVYADPNFITTLPQPLVSNGQGRLQFWVPSRQRLDAAMINPNGSIQQTAQHLEPWTAEREAWTYLTLYNGWSTGGAGTGVRYCITTEGLVLVSGQAISPSLAGYAVGTLPVGFRPQYQMFFRVAPSASTATAVLSTGGQLEIYGYTISTTYWFVFSFVKV